MHSSFFAVDVGELPREEGTIAPTGRKIHRKTFFSDPETGMMVRMVRYPAGVINPDHTHHCGHGMYVIEGDLVTHKGTFGPGCFVWFPEGETMQHGARAEADVVALFIINKPFDIVYTGGRD